MREEGKSKLNGRVLWGRGVVRCKERLTPLAGSGSKIIKSDRYYSIQNRNKIKQWDNGAPASIQLRDAIVPAPPPTFKEKLPPTRFF